MKKVIIHCGFHKTASSSIQRTLFENEALLRKHKINLLKIKDAKGNFFINHSPPIVSAFMDNPDSFLENIKYNLNVKKENTKYISEIKSQISSLANNETLLISGEGISELSHNSMHDFTKLFIGFEILVICYVRDSYGFYCSAIQERVKSGTLNLLNAPLLKRSQSANKLKKYFNNISFFSFSDACNYKGGPVKHFLDQIICNNEKFKIEKTNESISNKLTRLLSYINEKEPSVIGNKMNPLRANLSPYELEFSSGKFSLNQREYTNMVDDLQEENELLSTETGLLFTSEYASVEDEIELNQNEIVTLITKSKYLNARIKSIIWEFIEKYGKPTINNKNEYFDIDAGSSFNVDELRNTALLYEKQGDIPLAYKFMKAAYHLRPTGPVIKSNYIRYCNILEIKYL